MRNTLLEKLNWCYATKKMGPNKIVSDGKVNAIIESVRMAPTSSGTQPFELFVITNSNIRGEIRKIAWDQGQITDGSHLLVFAAQNNYTAERIDEVTALNVQARGELPLLGEYYTKRKANYLPRNIESNYAHAACQAYIDLGVRLIAAAEQEVGCTPMEGFDTAKVDEILGLEAKDLRSVVLMPLGYRDSSADWLLSMKKVRKSIDTMVTKIDESIKRRIYY